jgi:hypothetical protein
MSLLVWKSLAQGFTVSVFHGLQQHFITFFIIKSMQILLIQLADQSEYTWSQWDITEPAVAD